MSHAVQSPDPLLERLLMFVGEGGDVFTPARDVITFEGIRQMTDIVGDRNPAYCDPLFAKKSVFGEIIAPPASALSWAQNGWEPVPGTDWVGPDGIRRFRQDPNSKRRQGSEPNQAADPAAQLRAVLHEAGFVAPAVTNGEVEFVRQMRVGDRLVYSNAKVEAVVGPKKTALGTGYFVTTSSRVRDLQGEDVCRMRFVIYHSKPH